jgi:hypothetical protein
VKGFSTHSEPWTVEGRTLRGYKAAIRPRCAECLNATERSHMAPEIRRRKPTSQGESPHSDEQLATATPWRPLPIWLPPES